MQNYLINGYEHNRIYNFFEDICKIPHGSGNESAVADYICDFAKKNSLYFYRDSLNNVLIRKKASPGYESHPTVMLQGHTDMVCEKNRNTEHDFEKDPLKLVLKGNSLKADGTTLGGDDGIAVAAMLAVLEDNTLKHPGLECLFTVSEETGMDGALGFDYSLIEARKIINLDTELDGEAISSCAGGMDVLYSREIERIPTPARGIKLFVSGLAGGHSGADIHTHRANANRIMGEILAYLYNSLPFNLISLNGGNKRNAIARECEAELFTDDTDYALSLIYKAEAIVRSNLSPKDKKFKLKISKASLVDGKKTDMMTFKDTHAIIDALTLPPEGVIRYSPHINNFVVTSSNSGVSTTTEERFELAMMTRSSSEAELDALEIKFGRIATLIGMECEISGRYGGWEYDPSSQLALLYKECYASLFGKKALVNAIHAGLECGIIMKGIGEKCDAISIGPTINDIHTPEETLDLASCQNFYKTLLSMIEKL